MPKTKNVLQSRYASPSQGWGDPEITRCGIAVEDGWPHIKAALETPELRGRTIHVSDGPGGSGWDFRVVAVEVGPTKTEKLAEFRNHLDRVGIEMYAGRHAAFCSAVLGRNVLDDVKPFPWRAEDLSEADVDRVLEAARRL